MAHFSSKKNNEKHADGKRIDVSTPAPALTQNPFAALAQNSAAAPPAAPAPPTAPAPKPAESKPRGKLLLRRETKHRGGKTVVVVSGFTTSRDSSEKALTELEKQLKQRLGCGGTLDMEKREILIQGDRPEEIAAFLRGIGYEVGGVTSRPPGKK